MNSSLSHRALFSSLLGLVLLCLPPLVVAEDGQRGSSSTVDESPFSEMEVDLDNLAAGMPTIEDFGYYLSALQEWEKEQALNILADLASDAHLDPGQVAAALRQLLSETSPPTGLGYCRSCFKRQLSGALQGLRLRGPRATAPAEGIVVLRINDQFLKRLRPQALEEVGGTVPGLVQALLDGWPIAGKFDRGSYVRFHARDGDTLLEPAFFSSADALQRFEVTLDEPLDDWSLSRWLCQQGPKHRFEAGLLVLYFNPDEVLKEVRIPTAADSEEAAFRPVPLSETRSGTTCGGAPQWASENIPLSAFTRARYVPNTTYLEGM